MNHPSIDSWQTIPQGGMKSCQLQNVSLTNYPAASPTYRASKTSILMTGNFFGNPCIKWVRYFIILTIIWLSGVLWTSSDHQSDPIVTKAFQNPDGNCPSIYTQSKHYLSTIGSKLHHRKTIWPILDRMKFLELPNFTTVLPNFHRVVN